MGKVEKLLSLAHRLYQHGRWLDGEADGERLNMTGENIEGLSFWGRRLDFAVLRGVVGTGVDFRFAKCGGADFSKAKLPHGRFNMSDCSGAQFTGADLTGAKFNHANLRGAHLRGVTAFGVHFDKGTDLTGALLDLSTFTLWDGMQRAKIDVSQARALVARAFSYNCDSPEYTKLREAAREFCKGADIAGYICWL